MANLHITGIPELDRKLRYLSTTVAKKAARSALGMGMTVLAQSTRAMVGPALTPGHSLEEFKRSIRGTQKRERTTGVFQAKEGILVGKRGAKLRNWQVFHLLSIGTRDRYTGRKRQRAKLNGKWKWTNQYKNTGNPRRYTGRMRYQTFFRRGFAAGWPTALRVMVNQVAVVIAREAAKRP